MQATNGLADVFRLRTRVIGCATVIALALSALALALAPTAKAAVAPHATYLGLGDSVAFGYSQELFNENFPTENPEAFPGGYVTDYWEALKANKVGASKWKQINDGCPSETTDSFIGNGPVGKGLEAGFPGTHGEAPCAYKYVNGFRLHNEYEPGQSQLENTLQEIDKKKAIGHAVQVVSLGIGANDILHRIKQCEKEVAEGLFEGFGTPAEQLKVCEEASAGPLFTHVLNNIAGILYTIRNGSSFGGVNYTGKIVFDGYYDPFGSVFQPGVEVQPGSNLLDLLLNAKARRVVGQFGACYADPQRSPANHALAFNPLTNGEAAAEPERLQKWTNMANTTFAVNGNKAKNGPDIHPTPEGYQVLAKNIEAECP